MNNALSDQSKTALMVIAAIVLTLGFFSAVFWDEPKKPRVEHWDGSQLFQERAPGQVRGHGPQALVVFEALEGRLHLRELNVGTARASPVLARSDYCARDNDLRGAALGAACLSAIEKDEIGRPHLLSFSRGLDGDQTPGGRKLALGRAQLEQELIAA